MPTTVIVPVYNGERFLAPLLDSLLAQSEPDWRCICVNDGSTDGSREILSRYAAHDGRITVVDQPNAGCGAARNAALARVETPFLMFADQDDVLHPQAVEIAAHAIEREKVDCLLFGFERFEGSPRLQRLAVDPPVVHTNRNGVNLITGRRNSWPIFVWRHIFRTASVRAIPFPPISGGEDQAWMSELSWNNLSWASIDPVLYFNRADSASRSRGVSDFYVRNVHDSYEWIRRRAKLYNIDPRWTERYIRHMKFMFTLSCIYRKWLRSFAESVFSCRQAPNSSRQKTPPAR